MIICFVQFLVCQVTDGFKQEGLTFWMKWRQHENETENFLIFWFVAFLSFGTIQSNGSLTGRLCYSKALFLHIWKLTEFLFPWF